jgi:hypothetical protein
MYNSHIINNMQTPIDLIRNTVLKNFARIGFHIKAQ